MRKTQKLSEERLKYIDDIWDKIGKTLSFLTGMSLKTKEDLIKAVENYDPKPKPIRCERYIHFPCKEFLKLKDVYPTLIKIWEKRGVNCSMFDDVRRC